MVTEPTFIPKDGQVDFTDVRWCPVINCVLSFGDTVLLVRRSTTMRLYPGYWNGISGFLDDAKNLEEKVYEELSEELGLSPADIVSIKHCGVFNQEAAGIGKTWIVHAVRVEVKTIDVTLDWEASGHAWCTYPLAGDKELLPGFETVLKLTCQKPNDVMTIVE
jgi:ADP-ribose pyrophosphatase YjhB (NUDIX family)